VDGGRRALGGVRLRQSERWPALSAKIRTMLSDLEFSFSPVRDKVRDLREYL